jgi:hypothetical protein
VDLGERDFGAVIGGGDDDGSFLPGGVLGADDRGLADPGWEAMAFSMSIEKIPSPPLLITSLSRPVILK